MGTHYDGTAEEVRALDTYIKLTRAAQSVENAINADLSEAGLTVSQFGTLESLYHLGPMCQSEIAGKILKSSGNMTTVIDNLEREGLVERARDPNDRRQVIVSLTVEGRSLIERIFPPHVRAVVETFNTLSPDEQETLGRLCRKLGLSVHQKTV